MRWAGHSAHIGESRGVYRGLVEKPKGNRPLGSLGHRWVDNNKNLQEVGWVGLDLIDLAKDRKRWRAFVNAATNFRAP
jgi:hypothetical protein